MHMMKDKLLTTFFWVIASVMMYFIMVKDLAPEWAKDIEVLLGFGIFLLLLNAVFDEIDKL